MYKAFKEQITGNHKPQHHNTEAADAMAKFITESVAATSKGAAKDLCSYFNAVPRAMLTPVTCMTVLGDVQAREQQLPLSAALSG